MVAYVTRYQMESGIFDSLCKFYKSDGVVYVC